MEKAQQNLGFQPVEQACFGITTKAGLFLIHGIKLEIHSIGNLD